MQRSLIQQLVTTGIVVGSMHINDTRTSIMTEHWNEKLREGTPVLIRPITPDDAERERLYIEALSQESRYYRFLHGMRTPSPELIRKLTEIDHAHEVAFVALVGSGAQLRQVGVARYCGNANDNNCECAVSVSDDFQNKGLGTLLMRHLIEHARANGIHDMYSVDATDNQPMWDLTEHLGFKHHQDPDDTQLIRHSISLRKDRHDSSASSSPR
jgi:GNAT superfamily N-acetyltransferase